jgi:hypothetical protein
MSFVFVSILEFPHYSNIYDHVVKHQLVLFKFKQKITKLKNLNNLIWTKFQPTIYSVCSDIRLVMEVNSVGLGLCVVQSYEVLLHNLECSNKFGQLI